MRCPVQNQSELVLKQIFNNVCFLQACRKKYIQKCLKIGENKQLNFTGPVKPTSENKYAQKKSYYALISANPQEVNRGQHNL